MKTFYLTTTAKRKNAKRHIMYKAHALDPFFRLMALCHQPRYLYEIYSGSWKRIGYFNQEGDFIYDE